jgi:hypothetical protein
MYLIQMPLPVFNNSGRKFPTRYFRAIKELFTARFNGLTASNRAPAEGLLQKKGTVQRDDIIVFEVMVVRLETKWWQAFKVTMEKQFQQDTHRREDAKRRII